MESTYRTWVHAMKDSSGLWNSDELHRDLNMALGTAKWQADQTMKETEEKISGLWLFDLKLCGLRLFEQEYDGFEKTEEQEGDLDAARSSIATIYGRTFLFWMGNKPRLAVAEPDMIKELTLTYSSCMEKIPFSLIARPLLGYGLLSLNGQRWAVHRRITNKAFTLHMVKSRKICDGFLGLPRVFKLM